METISRLLVLLPAAALTATAAAAPERGAATGCVLPSDHATALRFRTPDHVSIAGVSLGRGRVAVVLAHQLNSDRCDWLPFARVLKAAGYRAVAFDFRNFGASQHVGSSVHLERDVIAAAAEARRLGSSSVVLMGASMGGTAVLTAAPSIRPVVAGVVSLSGPALFVDMDALAAVRRLQAPAVFAVGKYDAGFVADEKALYAAAASKDKQLVVRPTGYHGTDLLFGAQGAPLRKLLLGFVRAHG